MLILDISKKKFPLFHIIFINIHVHVHRVDINNELIRLESHDRHVMTFGIHRKFMIKKKG